MGKAIIILKSVGLGLVAVLAGGLLMVSTMYIYVHYINGAYRAAITTGMGWDPISVFRQWGLSTFAIQIVGLGGLAFLFLGGSLWGFRLIDLAKSSRQAKVNDDQRAT